MSKKPFLKSCIIINKSLKNLIKILNKNKIMQQKLSGKGGKGKLKFGDLHFYRLLFGEYRFPIPYITP